MDHQSARTHKSLPSLSIEAARKLMGEPEQADLLEYYAWPQTFGSTRGPWPGIGGMALTLFTMEAWAGTEKVVVFCNGKLVGIIPIAEFTPGAEVRERSLEDARRDAGLIGY